MNSTTSINKSIGGMGITCDIETACAKPARTQSHLCGTAAARQPDGRWAGGVDLQAVLVYTHVRC